MQFIEWDALDPEARHGRHARAPDPSEEPDLLFDREWATETTAAALEALREEMVNAGKGEQFDHQSTKGRVPWYCFGGQKVPITSH